MTDPINSPLAKLRALTAPPRPPGTARWAAVADLLDAIPPDAVLVAINREDFDIDGGHIKMRYECISRAWAALEAREAAS